MSLRVLLADESASIRKVFQMGLQDFGAEVKTVHNGLDVIEVAQNYKPDIIFADVLLQKKNGYEVCEEMGQIQELQNIPVVLMWSSFMELDQKRYQSCGAKGELEKPFDVEAMRNQITNLVAMTGDQQISQFLDFPESISREFVEDEKQKSAEFTASGGVLPPTPSDAPQFEMEAIPEVDDSMSGSVFNLPSSEDAEEDDFKPEVAAASPAPTPQSNDEEQWQSTAISLPSIPEPVEAEPKADLDGFESMDLQQDKPLNLDEFLYKPEPTPVPEQASQPAAIETSEAKIENVVVATQTEESKISDAEMEAIIRQETRIMVQSIIKDQLPAILEKVVRDELEKVLQKEMAIKQGSPSSP